MRNQPKPHRFSYTVNDYTAVNKEKGIEKSQRKWYNIYIKTVIKR